MANSMDMALIFIQMETNMKVNEKMENRAEKVSILLSLESFMKENTKIIKKRALAFTSIFLN